MQSTRTTSRKFITAREAAQMAGLSAPSLSRRIKAGRIPTFCDPSDDRVKLIDVADMERFLEPTLIQQKDGPTAA